MKLFKPLLDTEYLRSFMSERTANPHSPRSRRYAKKYGLLEGFTPKTNNLLGLAKNTFCSLARSYNHGKYQLIWIKKEHYSEGPRIKRQKPENSDDYREIILLNSFDLFIHTVIAHHMRTCLLDSGQMHPIRSPQKNIIAVKDFIFRAIHNNRHYYFQTDIKRFGQSFDIDLAKVKLIQRLGSFIDSEDTELLINVYDSFKVKTNGIRVNGSPIDQLFGEFMLSQLDNSLRNTYDGLIDNYSIRFGEDMVFAFPTREYCFSMDSKLRAIVRNVLGPNCEIHDICTQQTCPQRELKWGVPLIIEKGVIDRFDSLGFDFCGYHYSIKDTVNVLVGIRRKTMEKIANRIKEHTEGGNIRYHELPGQNKLSRQIRTMVNSLNELFGFHYHEGRWQFSKLYGIGSLFCLPPKMDNSLIYKQALRLNHYMLRRIRHLHFRNIPGYGNCREWREKVDKDYRKIGLRTVMDARNKIIASRPYNYHPLGR